MITRSVVSKQEKEKLNTESTFLKEQKLRD